MCAARLLGDVQARGDSPFFIRAGYGMRPSTGLRENKRANCYAALEEDLNTSAFECEYASSRRSECSRPSDGINCAAGTVMDFVISRKPISYSGHRVDKPRDRCFIPKLHALQAGEAALTVGFGRFGHQTARRGPPSASATRVRHAFVQDERSAAEARLAQLSPHGVLAGYAEVAGGPRPASLIAVMSDLHL